MQQLKKILRRIDRRGYKAYKDIQGAFTFATFQLSIDHVQADPYASPSRVRITISRKSLSLGEECDNRPWRRVTTIDYFARQVDKALKGQRGLIIDAPGQEVLDRTACKLDDKNLEIRLSVHLPARGRTILGKQAESRLCQDLPNIIEQAVMSYDKEKLNQCLILADEQQTIRQYLSGNDYISFVADGAVLPRESGVSNRPLKSDDVVTFQSPPSLRIEIPLPNGRTITGMGIKKGITLIVGGGYHGKSTLLEAIERGVYNHIAGDGREYVITEDTACKVRAEDGRSVKNVNISPFITNLPAKKDTRSFSTDNASGSTSQATNIMESLEAGASTLLIDEDTSATNFMIRDRRMQELVVKEKEPITPFIDKVRALYDDYGISTVLVVGGAGDYFDVADHIVMMDEYHPFDVTKKAKEIAAAHGEKREMEASQSFGEITTREPIGKSFNARKGKKDKVDAKGLKTIFYGRHAIDLSAVEQLIDQSQTRAIARAIKHAAETKMKQGVSLHDVLDKVENEIEDQGLDSLSPFKGKHPGDLARPRRFEIAAAINRYRELNIND